jgi:integrase
MADIDDPTKRNKKLERRWAQLYDADIDERDRDAIERFVNYRRDVENVAISTRIADLSTLRCASDRAETPLVDMELADAQRFLGRLVRPESAGGWGLDPDGSGAWGYRRALRVFYKWADVQPDLPDIDWVDRIELPDIELEGAADRDEMLLPDEIETLKDACENPRDRAIIAFLADTALRVAALCSLRVGDIDLDGEEPSFSPNEDAVALKSLDRDDLPILYSRAELRTWLRTHHPDPRDEAPLWPTLVGYDPENPHDHALGGDGLRSMLRRVAGRTDVEKAVEPHNFRRTAATRLSNSDRLTPQEIVHVMGWSDERMLDVYDYTTDAERSSQIHQQLGFSDGATDDDESFDLSPVTCWNCKATLSSSARFCERCGVAVDGDAKEARDDVQDALDEDLLHLDDATKRELGLDARQDVEDNDTEATIDALADAVAARLAGGAHEDPSGAGRSE